MAAFNEQFREAFPHGSAHWATWQEIDPLHRAVGLELGYDERGNVLRHPGDQPCLMLAGSGAGKGLSGGLVANAIAFPGNMLIVDLKGEIASVSIHNQVRLGKYAYCVNPAGLHGLPNHPVDGLDILQAFSKTLVPDAKALAELFIPPGNTKDPYFADKGRLLIDAAMVADAEMNGTASLRRVYKIISAIDGDIQYFVAFCERASASSYEHVRRVLAEIVHKLNHVPKEAGAIVGEATKALSFADDPSFLAGIDKPAFSLSVLCERPCNVYLNIPAEYVGVWSPYLRLLIGVAMLYKQRKPQAPRVVFMIDEAGQLGKAPFLLRAMTFGRGAGIQTQVVFQDIGQIIQHYGREGVQTIFGSSAVQQIFGVRDFETAELVSRTLGNESLEVNPALEQAAARTRQTQIISQLMDGADAFEAGMEYSQQERAAAHRKKMMRPLLTPDEVLRLPDNRQILIVYGIQCAPIAAYRGAYFTQRRLAGQFHPNPYHPPLDRVRVRGFFGMKWAEVVREPVPKCFEKYPQYQDGYWSTIKGYRPSIH